MRLRELRLTRYRQFIDEKLILDPYVTAIVGRNDTGKTGLLDHFFDQCVYEGVISSADRSLVPTHQNARTVFSMLWEIFPDDYGVISLPPEFGPPGHHTLEVSFQELDRPGKYWRYCVDRQEIDVYEGVTKDGMPIRPDRFRQRYIFPTPRYISVARLMKTHFEAQPWDLHTGAIELPVKRSEPESLLLRLAGVRARTRDMIGIDQPWEGPQLPASALTPREINERLAVVSGRITEKLRVWWHDPPGLVFEAKLAGDWSGAAATRPMNAHAIQTLIVTCAVHDPDDIPYHGTGLMWFISFLIEWLAVEDSAQPLLLLFDEPATPLHPSAQRVVAKLLATIALRHQVIYSTHSPFMIDWDFPQRTRMLVRDSNSKRTHINNKPYHPREGVRQIWNPLRSTIGVTLGDVGVIADKNVFVEGVTDQILLANASALLRERGVPHLDLTTTSIIPYGDLTNLSHLIGIARNRKADVIVVTDADQQGSRVITLCRQEGISHLTIEQFSDRGNTDCGIEDVIGIESYIADVNTDYQGFEWFRPLDVETVRKEIGNLSLGRYLQKVFEEQFGRSFDKVAVAISLAGKLGGLPEPALGRVRGLIASIRGS